MYSYINMTTKAGEIEGIDRLLGMVVLMPWRSRGCRFTPLRYLRARPSYIGTVWR